MTNVRKHVRVLAVAPTALLLLAGLAACGSSGKSAPPSTAASAHMSSPEHMSTAAPASMFSTASVAGLGTVVVDAHGHTVYVLTSGHRKNVPCTDASGCTKIWPDLALPDGVKTAHAGSGLHAALLGTQKLPNGEIYPTYNGWLMYEYSGDSGPAQSNGEGIRSFGGVWYALRADGTPATSAASSSSSGGGGGYY
jgi:predicted lipoprotein with Yx(FWY)xxD motif